MSTIRPPEASPPFRNLLFDALHEAISDVKDERDKARQRQGSADGPTQRVDLRPD